MARQPSTMPDDCGADDPRQEVSWFSSPPMRYPSLYCWLVLVSSMDIMLTWVILERGGTEVNPVANLVIAAWNLPGAIIFKFSLMLFVIVVCEISGRDRNWLGRGLAQIAVLVSSVPVVYSLTLLFVHGTW